MNHGIIFVKTLWNGSTKIGRGLHSLYPFVNSTATIMKLLIIFFKKEDTIMITLCLVVLILAIIAILILALAGIVAVAWPVLIILGIGLFIDILTLKIIFGRKKG